MEPLKAGRNFSANQLPQHFLMVSNALFLDCQQEFAQIFAGHEIPLLIS
jgi:hypothetical protein